MGAGRDQLNMLGGVVRLTGLKASEKVRRPQPVVHLSQVPATVDELTTEWLTAALCLSVPGAAVVSFMPGARTDGTSTRQALAVTYNDAGAAAGLPTALYTKSTPRLISRIVIGITDVAASEATFYRSIRQHLQIGAPAGYFGAVDPRSCRSMILMEDIVTTRGATFGSAVDRVDRPAAESMVRALAAHHGQMWEDRRLGSDWQLRDAASWQRHFDSRARMTSCAMVGFRWAGDEIPAALRSRRSDVAPAFLESLVINSASPETLLHQDVHPGNWFALPDGSRHLYDWQGTARGSWALDFGYTLSAGLETDDRRAWERDLLGLYLDELGAAGGHPPTFDDAFLAYRQQLFHGLIFWTYTFFLGKFSEFQPDEIVRTLVRRTAQAVVDLDAIDSVGKL